MEGSLEALRAKAEGPAKVEALLDFAFRRASAPGQFVQSAASFCILHSAFCILHFAFCILHFQQKALTKIRTYD
jgi:hypothetical protein